MKAVSIRNIPDETYEALKKMAAANHRSLQEQIRCLLDREVRLAGLKTDALAKARQWRQKLAAGVSKRDVVDLVREDRAR